MCAQVFLNMSVDDAATSLGCRRSTVEEDKPSSPLAWTWTGLRPPIMETRPLLALNLCHHSIDLRESIIVWGSITHWLRDHIPAHQHRQIFSRSSDQVRGLSATLLWWAFHLVSFYLRVHLSVSPYLARLLFGRMFIWQWHYNFKRWRAHISWTLL